MLNEEINSLDKFEKTKVYLDWWINHLIIYKLTGWCKDDLETTSEQFCNAEPIIYNHGSDWKERGYAQEIRTDEQGIYNWYWKMDDSPLKPKI